MRLVGDPGLPPSSLPSRTHLSAKPSPIPASPSCPIAARILGPESYCRGTQQAQT